MNDAAAVLRGWPAPTPEQQRLRDAFLHHLAQHRDGTDRSCYPNHITASTLILSADHTRVLLTLHAKAKAWFQMGGHCEPGDATLDAAALREAVEESGMPGLVLDPVPVQLSAHEVPFCDPRGGVRHLDVRFLAVAPDSARAVVSDESDDVAWWPVDALPNRDPDMVELVDLALRRARVTVVEERA